MHPVSALERLGGTARFAELVRLTDRSDLTRVVDAGDIVRDSRGRYSLVDTDEALRTANRVTGVLSHTSAALHWGWKVKEAPAKPHVTFRRKRRPTPKQRKGVVAHWFDLPVDSVVDGQVTTKSQTLIDCLRHLPFDEALAIADSALRAQDISPAALVELAAGIRGSGARQARRVAACADGRAANPFESVLRAIALSIPGLHLIPQGVVSGDGIWGQHDLVDFQLKLVLEADSHTWHSTREALRSDCRRYNTLVTHGWLVLRFAWEDVMGEPELVRAQIVAVTGWELRRTTGNLAS